MSGARRYAVSLHDVAPATWPACRRLLEEVVPRGVAVTLLVVPHYHGGTRLSADPPLVAALARRIATGDDLVLHGYRHRDEGPAARNPLDWARRRLYTASEGEFAALDAAEATRRIALGRAELARARLEPCGFIAPAWLMSAGTREALRGSGLAYTSTRDWLIRPADGARLWAPSLTFSTRAAWRRAASTRYLPHRLGRLSTAPLVRAALHPADAGFPEVMARWRTLLAALAVTRTPALERACLAKP